MLRPTGRHFPDGVRPECVIRNSLRVLYSPAAAAALEWQAAEGRGVGNTGHLIHSTRSSKSNHHEIMIENDTLILEDSGLRKDGIHLFQTASCGHAKSRSPSAWIRQVWFRLTHGHG